MSSRIFRDDLLEGRVALVTGGGTGIGAAIALELGRLGARVAIASRKREHVVPRAAALSRRTAHPVTAHTCDIRDRDQVAALADEVLDTHGRIDLLVNNAGGQFLAPAETITPRGWDAVVATNLTGTWNLTRAVADRWMLANGGKIVNITMLTARGFPGMAHSVAARAGVEAMTRTLAVEWAPRGIQVNAVEPGIIASEGLRRYPDGETMARSLQSEIPAKRLGRPEEIAWMVAYLAGPAGDYITGQVLVVDGGRTLWGQTWPLPDPEPLPEVALEPPAWLFNEREVS